jgi:hypothetical protein
MLKGFSVPLTPDGKSALASSPPWHYSSDCLVIEYWADPPGGIVADLAIVDVWEGSAELSISEVRGEDMHALKPLRIGRGYRLGMAYSVTDLKILRNYVK